jgi:hypothetical protein
MYPDSCNHLLGRHMKGSTTTGCLLFVKEKSPATLIVLMTVDDKEVILSKIKGTAVAKALFKPFTLAEMDVTVQGLLHP